MGQGAPTARDPFAGRHAVPLPPVVWRRVQAYVERTTDVARAAGRLRSPGCSPWFELAAPAAERTGISTKIRCATPHDVRRAFASYLHEEARISSDRVGLVMGRATSDLPHVTDDNGMARRYTRDEILALKAKTELKAQLVAEHRRQRGIGDAAAERARRRSASAKAHAEGRTTRQRQRRGPVGGAEPA